ncbi:sugar phosphate isomerase/epimerase family protein [Staphylococcus gallinarum]|uniref:sugar phosphate isomerase/epimerase family protein n=1 Tax=Staphylococcus gallinarum TaxID=1293 RepID=UPI001E4E8223|nr:sugar phosphate isomerase/epimerase [Staphylococcus gallinarum]MCD8828883.1 sugar phosphate isomerase/epimerase [Staphylococcus gallinarum]MCD8902793.1 sugar phosphate isomerase/epimerase [Staphylococcus gallinarum]MEB6055631.1 sugar phosphate isomerase/epimerase [Staphylococcus gallinarum]MEB6237240.1 sugar phosphate isomerase/epimerase [Staphylococcus gallinarum]
MKNTDLVFNTLVAQEKINSGLTQLEIFDYIVDLGFNSIEVRREYFKNIDSEVEAIAKYSKAQNITILYSVPEVIFLENGELNPNIEQYFTEACNLHATHVKMTIGNYQNKKQLQNLKIINEQPFNFTVENDQTEQSGTINNILKFLTEAEQSGINIGYTYDLGNFRYVGESEIVGAEALKDYVKYIHLKNVTRENDLLRATSLEQGDINWRKVTMLLPNDVPVALEYPSNIKEEILTDKRAIEVLGYGN